MSTDNPFSGDGPAPAPELPGDDQKPPVPERSAIPTEPLDKVRASDPVQSAVLGLVSGGTPKSVESALAHQLGVPKDVAEEAVRTAQEQIVLASTIDRQKEVGVAYHRLNDVYSKANKANDLSTALSAQRELSKLLDLYRPLGFDPSGVGQEDSDRAEIELARRHLASLELGDQNTTTAELARLAVAKIISLESSAK